MIHESSEYFADSLFPLIVNSSGLFDFFDDSKGGLYADSSSTNSKIIISGRFSFP